MARLRYNGLVAALGASLTSSATSVTFASALTHVGGAVPTISGSDYIPLTLLDSNGVPKEIVYLTAYTAAATTGTIARGKEGTTGVAHSNGAALVNSATAEDIRCAGVIQRKVHNPGTLANYGATTTIADMDATNMAVTFVAPLSGEVDVHLTALTSTSSANSSNNVWHLRNGTTTVASRYMAYLPTGSTPTDIPGAAIMNVAGLTPGTSYTLKWAHSTTAGTAQTYAGGVAGAAIMEVHAVPA